MPPVKEEKNENDAISENGTRDSDNQEHSNGKNNGSESEGRKKRITAKRRKVNHACLYCRRSHMTCDEGRPCQRCIKRQIGHLCHDEPRNPPNNTSKTSIADQQHPPSLTRHMDANILQHASLNNLPLSAFNFMPNITNLGNGNNPTGNEFSILSEFLESLDATQGFLMEDVRVPALTADGISTYATRSDTQSVNNGLENREMTSAMKQEKKEKFFLTAADQPDGSRDERLRRVINAKYEAGYLKPYNYVNGYARLQRYMEKHMSPASRQRILRPLSIFRPAFRAVAQSLTDIDLVLVEEDFERLLLDYDRVFSSMGIPACLWRRTGEIYKGNKEFAALVGVPVEMLREGRLCIYELMTEESTVNYWEKYGNIAFDAGQKAVLTSCLLKNPKTNQTTSCCFSFTIRRDKYNIPTIITGNFLPVSL